MIITISGMPGSGKTTLAKQLAKKFHLKHYSAGDFMRQIAKERRISLLELSALAENDKSIDEEIDRRTVELGKTRCNFVIDSRLAWHFIPDSIKIFVDISLEEAARRVYADTIKNLRSDEKENTSLQKTLASMKKRQASEKKRYKQLYCVDFLDKKKFDIVINSTRTTEKEKFEKTVKEIEKFLKG